MESKSRTRLTMDQKMRVLAYISRGDTVSQVVAHVLEDFDISITEDAIYKIRRDNADTISKIQERLADSAAADIDQLIRKSRVQIARKLNKAEHDASELDKLDQQYRDGEIEKDEYQRQKTGRINLSISELASLGQKLVSQQRGIEPELPPAGANPALPPGSSTPAQLEAILKAIQSGDTVELQRIIFTPGVQRNDQSIQIQG